MTPLSLKLLIYLLALTLLVSCIPGFVTPTPVPPLDANAVNLFIAQTADAASIQTVAAMPTSTAIPTSTSTPRSTWTPEPTFTPVQTIVFPTSTPIIRVQYYRLKHDDQLAIYNYKSRTFDGNSEGMRNQAPEIVPLFLLPKRTSGSGRTTVDGAWETYINALNNNDESKINYLKSDISALFNTAGFPQMESLTMGGNIVTLAEVQGAWGRVNTLDYGSPPNAAEVNYFTRPDLVHKFVVVGWKRDTKSTILVRPPKGDVYYPFVSRRPVWVEMERLEKFPSLPMEVTATVDLYVQPEPVQTIEETDSQISAGESVNVIEYYPTGSSVWGRIRGGWIPLVYYRQYMTSWKMETIPPP
ncbi:MAG TPA: hypothetical protein VK897_07485 [Anaerolineales bacterium]|nr:hypothetical protein [Anaerolineales bacterium]